ncbi:MAG: hypothetical protein WAM60_13765 [Candidatus Promineifilaceae bacterium]
MRYRGWRLVLFLALLAGFTVSLSGTADAQPHNGPILLYFRGTALDSAIKLEWETAVEFDTVGFTIDRADSETGPYIEQIGFIPAVGGPLGAYYEEIDDVNVNNGHTYWYILNEIKDDASIHPYGPISVTVGIPIFNYYLPVIYTDVAINDFD